MESRGNYFDMTVRLIKKTIRLKVVAVPLLFVMFMTSFEMLAQNVTKEDEYRKLSVAVLKKKAQYNDALAQYILGLKYQHGEGISKNLQKSYYWFKKSADNNYPPAFSSLADIYGIQGDFEKVLLSLRKGASLGDGRSYYCLFYAYKYGKYGLQENKAIAGAMLVKAAEARFDCYYILAVDYNYGSDGLPEDKDKAIYWYKKACDSDYESYLYTGKMPKEGDGWPAMVKFLKELGCDYDPALHVDDYKVWKQQRKSVSSTNTASNKTNIQRTNKKSVETTSSPLKIYHYTKSGRGQEQSTGTWTDNGIAESCDVEFFKDHINVNGFWCDYVRDSGLWKVYKAPSFGRIVSYYYVDSKKNMKYVSEFFGPYGSNTFVYPMSTNGDPTPIGGYQSNRNYNSSGSSSSSGPSTGGSTRKRNERVCSFCNGTKNCHVCKGTGIAEDTMFGTGKAKCSICNGSGRCTHCR